MLSPRPINGTIALTSTESTGGSFDVGAWTSNGKVEINFVDQPVDSELSLTARTSNAPIAALLHPAYEGKFRIATSIFRPSVIDLGSKDPSGQGRERSLKVGEGHGYRGLVNGSTWWGEEKGTNSSVNLSSSNAKAWLVL